MGEAKPVIGVDDFAAVDMRVGIVREVRAFPEARKPAWQLRVDFGPELGEREPTQQTDPDHAGDAEPRRDADDLIDAAVRAQQGLRKADAGARPRPVAQGIGETDDGRQCDHDEQLARQGIFGDRRLVSR